MLRNKRGHIDARNILGIWSFFKWIIDVIIVVVGGGIFTHQPPTGIWSLLFILWAWTFLKMVVDTPLVLIWLWGKINNKQRKKRKKRKRKKKYYKI